MKKFVGFIALLALVLPLHAQLNLDSLDAYYAKAMVSFDQPGMSIGIVQDNQLVFAKGYGKRNLNKPELVNEQTVFQLASLSKAFTAAAIGVLVDDGKLKWDDKVIDHLPTFKLYDPFVTRDFTIRDLLCHRNGYDTFDGDLLWYGTSYSRQEILKRFANLPPKHGFRDSYGYSNIMFIAAALVIEAKSGKTWEEFITDRIFKPLQMTSSSITMSDFKNGSNFAYPHVKNTVQTHIDYNNAAGAVGVNSNITDLSKWAMMWLNKGKSGDKQVLSEQTIRELLSAKTAQPVSAKQEQNGIHFKAAASGWFVQDFKGVKMAHHSGGLPGFILNLALIPEKNLAVIVLTNGETLIPFALTNYTLEKAITGQSKDWATEYASYNQPKKEEKTVVTKPSTTIFTPEELVGKYEDNMYGTASITLEGKQAKLVLDPTKELFTSTLEPISRTNYKIKFVDPFLPEGTVTFNLNQKGEIIGFTIDLPNPDFNFYNLNFKKTDSNSSGKK